MKVIMMKPRLDGSGAPPSVKEQQKKALTEKEGKKKKPGEEEQEPGEKETGDAVHPIKRDGGPGSGPPGGGASRRMMGIGQTRRKRGSQKSAGQTERRTPKGQGFVGRRQIKVTPQVAPLAKPALIKSRL